MADEVGWIFVGVIVGVPLGMVVGYLAAQLIPSKISSGKGVVVEKVDGKWVIHEE